MRGRSAGAAPMVCPPPRSLRETPHPAVFDRHLLPQGEKGPRAPYCVSEIPAIDQPYQPTAPTSASRWTQRLRIQISAP